MSNVEPMKTLKHMFVSFYKDENGK